MGNETVLLQLI